MFIRPTFLALTIAIGLSAGIPSAMAQTTTFTLTPPNPCPPPSAAPHGTLRCGASRLRGNWTKPAGAVAYEEQYIEVDVSASRMLQSSLEHVAISAFAGAEPFNASGQWTNNASGGGVGIALGNLHTCPGGPSPSNVQLAIERFDWGVPMDSNLVACVNVSKAALINVPTVRLSIYVKCIGTTCESWATIDNAATLTLLGSVAATGILLENPLPQRRVFYSVSNFVDETFNYSPTFKIRWETYFAH